ncbi:MPT63 family protein, partial [Mycobacterium marinum]
MKLTTMIKTAVAVVAIATIATITAPIVFAAYPITGKFGSELKMTDSVGQVVLGWTVSDLKSSSDVIP